jgi:hypothetical protein
MKRILTVSFLFFSIITFSQTTITIDFARKGRIFEGIGALSAGASSRLLIEYPEPYRSQILDFLFKPRFGASLQQLKVEIGGDVNSTCGTEPSHAHSLQEFENPLPEYFQRGYEWWLMKEAKKRNPAILLDCLEWGCPGWIGNGNFFSQDNADYIIAFLQGAEKYHGLKIDYTGIWNEREYDASWIKLLRKTLDKNKLEYVKIIAADNTTDFTNPDASVWNIVRDMTNDKELNDAIYAVGTHYNDRWPVNTNGTTKEALALNKSLRNSEGGPWKGNWDGFEDLVKMYIRSYPAGKITNIITWSLITSYYDNLSIPNSGLMLANAPWCGYFETQPAIWAPAHVTQFTEPGWQYIDGGCGFIEGGSYITLQNPETGDFSIIVETMDNSEAQKVTFQLSKDKIQKHLSSWFSTKRGEEFVRMKDIILKNNSFTLELRGKSIYSITTTRGQQKGSYSTPSFSSFPFPFKTTFEDDSLGQLPKYFIDQSGLFEVQERMDGKGKCVRQVMTQQGIEWGASNAFVESVIGDTSWTNYEVSTDFNMLAYTGYAIIMGRVIDVNRGDNPPAGYWVKICDTHKCELYAGEEKIASGNYKPGCAPFTWHSLKLRFEKEDIKVLIDNDEVISSFNNKYRNGMAGIGSGFNLVEFDNFEIR